MSCSKHVPPFNFDVLYYFNRDQLERFSIVCRPLKNFIAQYFHSKPYRVFDELRIRGGSYALFHNDVNWHPNRDDYSVQQFLGARICSIKKAENWWDDIQYYSYYSFTEMRPYLGPTLRIKNLIIYIAGDVTYNSENIKEMESIAYLWHNGDIAIRHDKDGYGRIGAENFQLILNSPTVLQCRYLIMKNPDFAFKDYRVLYTVKIIVINYRERNFPFPVINLNSWAEFLGEPGVKPSVLMSGLFASNIRNLLDRLSQAFSSAIVPKAFKIMFTLFPFDDHLTEFREMNKTSCEKLELKEGISIQHHEFCNETCNEDCYTLERSSI